MVSTRLALPVLALGLVIGCSSSSEEAPVAVDTAAATAIRTYDCSGAFGDDSLSRLEVGFAGDTLSITDLSKDAMAPDSGELDASFAPTSAFAGAVRYRGFPATHEALSGTDVARFELVVSKELVAREAAGKLFIRTSGSGGGDSTSYQCREKAAPLKVDVAKRARLACSLDRLICKDDNPPGSTCLGDLFVLQTTDRSATMKLTFMEHFGVHIVERKEQLGAATSMARSATSFAGTWNDGSRIALIHRAGITYTGTFTAADGEASSMKCNDLAMLD